MHGCKKNDSEIDADMGIARLGQWENMYMSVYELWLLLGMYLKKMSTQNLSNQER